MNPQGLSLPLFGRTGPSSRASSHVVPQIGSFHIFDEKEIAVEKRDRFIRTATDVGDEKAEILGCVTGGEQGFELDVSDGLGILREGGLASSGRWGSATGAGIDEGGVKFL